MNYTENYHLPQWVKEDRIMMDDFNAAMAGIEAGLTVTAREAKGASQISGALEMKMEDRLFRLMYNHYCAMQDMEPFPSQIGVFHQNFARDPAGLTGTLLLNGKRFAGKSTATLSNETVSYQTLTPLRIVKNNLAASTPMTGIFKAPISGCVSDFIMAGVYANSEVNATFRLLITMTNRETGGVEYSVVSTFTNTHDNAGTDYHVRDRIYFLGGVEYLITAQPLDAICDMTQAEFSFLRPLATSAFTNEGRAAASRVFSETDTGDGGMAILRFLTGGTGGTLRFQWDGVERQPAITRISRMGDGQAFREHIYLRDDTVPASSSLALQFECNAEGNVILYDWGMIKY